MRARAIGKNGIDSDWSAEVQGTTLAVSTSQIQETADGLLAVATGLATEISTREAQTVATGDALASATVTPKVATPGFSTPRRYNGTGYFYVTISCATAGAIIYYRDTTSSAQGAPWASWKVYPADTYITNTLPSSTGHNKPVQACAIKSGWADSDTAGTTIPPG